MPTLKKFLISFALSLLIIYLFMAFIVKYVTPTQHVIESDLSPVSTTANK